MLGPLSDFISTDAGAAALVERFLVPTVNAVLVRDRSVAEAVRAWHASAAPGPLLLLPVDSVDGELSNGHELASDLAGLVQSASPASGWVRSLLGRVTSMESGTAFVDARGAGSGFSSLRRRLRWARVSSGARLNFARVR